MNWIFERHRSPDHIRIVSRGAFTVQQFEALFEDLFGFEGWEPLIPLFFDQRLVDYSGVTPGDLVAAANTFVSQNPRLAFTRIAVLFATPRTFEMARRFDEATRPASDTLVRVFMDEAEAGKWLFRLSTSA